MRSKSTFFLALAPASAVVALALSSVPGVAIASDCKLGNDMYCPSPFVKTTKPVEVKARSAVLTGEVNPEGATAVCYFEYGHTKAYGKTTPIQHVGPDAKLVHLRARITDLQEGTEYHYQLVCKSSGQTFFGGDVVFHTTGHNGSTPAPGKRSKRTR